MDYKRLIVDIIKKMKDEKKIKLIYIFIRELLK